MAAGAIAELSLPGYDSVHGYHLHPSTKKSQRHSSYPVLAIYIPSYPLYLTTNQATLEFERWLYMLYFRTGRAIVCFSVIVNSWMEKLQS